MLSSRCGKPSPSIPLRKRKGEGKRRCTRVHSPPPARRGFTFVFSLRNEGGRRAAAGGCSRHDAGSHPPRSPFASEGGRQAAMHPRSLTPSGTKGLHVCLLPSFRRGRTSASCPTRVGCFPMLRKISRPQGALRRRRPWIDSAGRRGGRGNPG